VAKTVEIKIKVNDDGSLSMVEKEAKKASKATDNLGKATDATTSKRNRFHKGEKGVAGATSNSTKAFAKQAQTINGGSSSLVGAYATLAANVFALSATFQFLKRAADVSNLEKQQVAYAATTGTALQSITARLRETSDGMLGFQEAASAAGIGLAKGFTPSQLNNLAVAARKASTALGRDFGDAFDRLLRGVSKAEPELLDELGITLRLESATRRYADALGTSKDKLTESQRSQAVYVETMRQANDLFGQVEPQTNAFIKLAKTFEDMAKAGTELVLPFFEGFANMISSNMVAALTVFGAIATSIFKMMFSFEAVGAATEKYDQATTAALKNTQAELESTKRAIKATEDSQKKAAKTAQNAAKRSGVKGGLIGKLASGKKMNAQQLGQTRAMLKRAEEDFKNHGEVRSKILKNVDIKHIRTMRRSLDLQVKLAKKANKQQIGMFKKLGMKGRRAYLSLKKRGISTFKAIGNASVKAGNLINKAMRMAGVVGVFLMVWDVAKKVISAPFSIIKSILSALDTAINAVKTGIANMINDLPDWAKRLMGLDDTKPVKFGVTDMAGSFENSGVGTFLRQFEEVRKSSEDNKEAMDNFRDAIKTMGEDATAVIEGLDNLTGKAREKAVLTSMQTLDVAGAMRKADETAALGNMDKRISRAQGKANAAEDPDEKKRLQSEVEHLKKLRAQIEKRAVKQRAELQAHFESIGLANLSEGLAQAVEEWNTETAENLTMAASAGLTGIKALNDEVDNLATSMASGDLLTAEIVLKKLKNQAEVTGTALKKSGEGAELAADATKTYSDAFKDEGGTDKVLEDIIAYNTALRANAEAMMVVNALGKERGAIVKARLDVEKADLDIEQNRLQQLREGIKPEELLKLQRLEKELKLKKQIAEIAVVTNEQGSFMGSIKKQSAVLPGAVAAYTKEGATVGDKAGALADFASPQLEELKKLGPDGEYMASVTEGALAITESFSTAFETIKEKGLDSGEGISAALGAGSALMQNMMKMSAAQTKKKVSDIDKQIAAEKKRDGKSKESVEKIKKLEKKKEDLKRKQFEREKKMKMAQVVMATAQAAMQAASAPPGLPWTAPFVAMAIAMGAAQLSAIKKSTYEGGGDTASAGASAKNSVSAGQRSNTVDLAQSRSAVGELGYARGREGIGNINNFTPAFSGARYRAGGGSTGYMVGEQGPELFMPDTPGTIVPAGEVSSAGGVSNVNISISAIDAAGVEDVLMNQRANIISMIRESANEVGEQFLETVDTISEGARS